MESYDIVIVITGLVVFAACCGLVWLMPAERVWFLLARGRPGSDYYELVKRKEASAKQEPAGNGQADAEPAVETLAKAERPDGPEGENSGQRRGPWSRGP